MRSTSRSRGDSSLQTGEIETQTTNVGPIAIRETTSHNPQTDQYESRTESSIIELIQDDRIVDCFKIMSRELNLNFKRCIYSTSDLLFPSLLKDLLSHD